MNSLEEKLTQVQKNLSFYNNNILEKFTAEDIVSLGLDSKGNITQESSVVMITADAVVIADNIADAILLEDMDIANNSCIWCSDWHR